MPDGEPAGPLQKVMICQHFVPGPPIKCYKAEKYCFGARGHTETSLKIVDLSWKYKKNNNEKIKIKCQWGLSWLSGSCTDVPAQTPLS